MSGVAAQLPAIHLIPNGQVTFAALAVGDTILSVRISQGWNQIAGIIRLVTLVAPGGELRIEQSMDGTNWDHIDSFPVTDLIPEVAFNVVVLARYVRVVFDNNTGGPVTIRIHGLLKTG